MIENILERKYYVNKNLIIMMLKCNNLKMSYDKAFYFLWIKEPGVNLKKDDHLKHILDKDTNDND